MAEINPVYIGTAGWTIPAQLRGRLRGDGSHLEDYARTFNAVEINSSFYREHQPATYARWAQCTPEDFRFAVKLSRYFTQETCLRETGPRLRDTLKGILELGGKLGVLLVQLPPSLEFHAPTAENFLADLRALYPGALAWEPRHASWASDAAVEVLARFQVNKVIADPERCKLSRAQRTRVEDVRYYRLHGSPEIYKSRYSPETLDQLNRAIQKRPARATWVIFDNTTYGHATENALELMAHTNGGAPHRLG